MNAWLRRTTHPLWCRVAVVALIVSAVANASVYDAMRAMNPAVDDEYVLSNGVYSGRFKAVASDPYGDGDDNGSVISCADSCTWWVRQFAHTAQDPIQLNWFELTNNQDITLLLTRLQSRYKPYFYCRVPTSAITLVVDFVDFSKDRNGNASNTSHFQLLESDAPVSIQHKSSNPYDRAVMMVIKNYVDAKVGGPDLKLTFRGIHKGIRGGMNSKDRGDIVYYSGPAGYEGEVSFVQGTASGQSLEFRANAIDSFCFGVTHVGGEYGYSTRTETVTLQGTFGNSGCKMNSGIKNLVLDSPHITDPYVLSQGWNGQDHALCNNGVEDGWGVCARQTRSGTGALVMNGSRVRNGVVNQVVPLCVTLTADSGVNLSDVTFRVTGTDGSDQTITRDYAGPNGSAFYSQNDFKTITGVSVQSGNLNGRYIKVGESPYYEENRGLWFQNLDKVTGTCYFEWGLPQWFSSDVSSIGNSANDRLTLHFKDIGYSATGVPVSDYYYYNGKCDPFGATGANKKFITFVEDAADYGTFVREGIRLEATSDSAAGGYHNEYVDVVGVNQSAMTDFGSGNSSFSRSTDWTRYTNVTGTWRTATLPDGTVRRGSIALCEYATVHDAVVPDISVNKCGFYCEGGTRYPNHVTVAGTRIIENGAITINEGAGKDSANHDDILLDTVDFGDVDSSQDARRVIYINNGANPAVDTYVLVNSTIAPDGAYIDADNRDHAFVKVDGTLVSLPYYFHRANGQVKLSISASPADGGTVSPDSGTHWYTRANNTVVNVSATAAPGYRFDCWIGNAANAAAAQTTVTMSQDQRLTASFVRLSTPLIIDNADNANEKKWEVTSGSWQTGSHATAWNTSDRYTWGTIWSSSNKCKWSTNALPAGTYDVYAWWQVNDYGTAVTYEIRDGATVLASANADQSQNYGTWVSLGRHTFTQAGQHNIVLGNHVSTSQTTVVYADAIKLAPVAMPLTTIVSPVGGGSVNPSGTTWRTADADVNVAASPATGYEFDHWEGDASGTTSSITVTMNTDKIITAVFKRIQRVATFNADSETWHGCDALSYQSAGGYNNSGYVQATREADGTPILYAASNSSNGCFTGSLVNRYGSGDISVTMYVKNDSVSVDGGTVDNTRTAGIYFYKSETEYWMLGTATAVASSGWSAVSATINTNWTDAQAQNAGWTKNYSGTNTWQALMQNVDGFRVATSNYLTSNLKGQKLAVDHVMFTSGAVTLGTTYNLAMAVSGGGTTTPTAGSTPLYDAGQVVNVSATPSSGYHFAHWTGAVANASSASTAVTMDAHKTVTAVFAPDDVIIDNADNSSARKWEVTAGSWQTGSHETAWNAGDRYTWGTIWSSFNKCKWSTDALPAGTYNVYAWWQVNDYGTTVKYEIYDGATKLADANVDQSQNYGTWVLLGQYTFTHAGQHNVILGNHVAVEQTTVLYADAVKFVWTSY